MPAPIPFIKMHGLGNDFVVVDNRKGEHEVPINRISLLADRKTGIGFDQFIVMRLSDKADVFMQILNADSSEVDACGNATRCVAWLIAEEKQVAHVTIETNAGVLSADVTGNQRVRVNMGKPKLDWNDIPLSENIVETKALPIDIDGLSLPVAVNMGNPHAVFFTEGGAHPPLAEFGPKIEHHALFPERVNVSLATVMDETNIMLHVWERGAGVTQACGTAACAALVAAHLLGHTENTAMVQLPGGRLRIEWDKDHSGAVFMVGDVATSFFGAF